LGAWSARLEECFKEDEVPDGWATIRDIADSTGVSVDTIRKRVEGMVLKGEAAKQNFNVDTKTGVKQVSHYKLN
tara:strand:- start:2664 stop:2885 length:222 start_codon:yes stop_codon:yes gene_type:complete